MPLKRPFEFFVFAAFVSSLLFPAGCGKNVRSEGDEESEKIEAAVPVETATVEVGDISAFFTGTATLESEEETEVVAKVGGVVKEIMVEEGDVVEPDQILAKLDDEELSVRLAQVKANLDKLANEHRRASKLFRKKLTSTEEYHRIKYEYEYQKAAYDLAKLEVEYTSIRTPIGGVVSERSIKLGNMVLPNQSVFHVTGLNPLTAVLYLPERRIDRVRAGYPARLSIDALDGVSLPGRIERISPVVDPATGTIKVTVELLDESKRTKPGMFARINIVYDKHEGAMLVPKESVITEDKESSVFVVDGEIARRRVVETGFRDDRRVEIVSGLEPGETIVTTGKGSLKEGTKVEIVSK